MLLPYFESGGPLMLGVAACWIVVLTLVFDRTLYWIGTAIRRPIAGLHRDLRRRSTSIAEAEHRLESELLESRRNLNVLSSLTHLATGVGLFGTVFGLCRSFLGRSEKSSISEAVVNGMSTALLTTLGGLAVFLIGQLFLIVFHAWTEALHRRGHKTLNRYAVGHGQPQ